MINFTAVSAGNDWFGRFMEMMEITSGIVDSPDAVELQNVMGQISLTISRFNMASIPEVLWISISPSNLKDGGLGWTFRWKDYASHLIPRFYDVSARNPHRWDKRQEHQTRVTCRNIGLVQQDVSSCRDHRENILYGNLSATKMKWFGQPRMPNHDLSCRFPTAMIPTLANGESSFPGDRNSGLPLRGCEESLFSY